MKVFLIQAPLWGLQPPIGVAQLGSYLLREGHDVTVFDVNIDLYNRRKVEYDTFWTYDINGVWQMPEMVNKIFSDYRSFIEKEYIEPIARSTPCVVGFSINSCSRIASLLLARWIKEAEPRVPIVFGGQQFGMPHSWEQWANWAFRDGKRCVDAVVIGDGEETFADCIARFSRKEDWTACAGLGLPLAEGGAHLTPRRRPVNLDTLPFADYTLFGWERYPGYHGHDTGQKGLYERGDMIFMASRGCIRHCSFCALRTPWPGFRTMSGERIFAEIRHQNRVHGPLQHLKFYDLLVNGNMKSLSRLCDLLLSHEAPPILWHQAFCVIRPEMKEEILRKMRRSGIHDITYGVESGSQKVLDLMRKQQTVAQAEAVIRDTHKAGINVQINLMVGYPGEAEEDFQQTLDFVVRNKDYLDTVYPSYTGTLLESNSPFGQPEARQALGIVGDDDQYWELQDGSNDYPLRVRRQMELYDTFEAAGVRVAEGFETTREFYKTVALASYYEYKKDYARALEFYESARGMEPKNDLVNGKIQEMKKALPVPGPA